LIKYPDFVSAKVLITTEQPTEHIIARYSGALENIYVENNDTVHRGQILGVIRNTAKNEDIFALQGIIDTIQIDINNFEFPLAATSNMKLGDVGPAYINFERSYLDYRLLKDLEPFENQLIGNKKSIDEIKSRLASQMVQKRLLEQEYELQLMDFKRYNQLFERGVISQQEYESKELEFIQIQKNISMMDVSISQMEEAISGAQQTLKTTLINKQEDNTRYLTNLSHSFNALKKAIQDWEHTYVLSSSTEGVISFQEFWGENQFVNMGDFIFSILPIETSELVGKLSISSQNAGMVMKGQKVLVKLDNFPYQQYGLLVGYIKNVAVSPDDQGNYFVYISLPNGTETSYNQNLTFEQELLGNAEIIMEDLSIAQRLFHNLNGVFKYN
jgi:multidrug resistance efflux pump